MSNHFVLNRDILMKKEKKLKQKYELNQWKIKLIIKKENEQEKRKRKRGY